MVSFTFRLFTAFPLYSFLHDSNFFIIPFVFSSFVFSIFYSSIAFFFDYLFYSQFALLPVISSIISRFGFFIIPSIFLYILFLYFIIIFYISRSSLYTFFLIQPLGALNDERSEEEGTCMFGQPSPRPLAAPSDSLWTTLRI